MGDLGLLKYMQDNNWPAWVVVGVLAMLAGGRNIQMFLKRKNTHEVKNMGDALRIANRALTEAQEAREAHRVCEMRLAALRFDHEELKTRVEAHLETCPPKRMISNV